MSNVGELEIHNAALARDREKYIEFLYARLQRQGILYRDAARMVNQNRNIFAACMVAQGAADAMVTGLTRRFSTCFNDVTRVFDKRDGEEIFGLTIHIAGNRTLFIADRKSTRLNSSH